MRKFFVILALFFVTDHSIASAGSEVIRCSKAINNLLLPEVRVVRESIQKHNKSIDEKTDTFIEAFIHYNFSKTRYIDELPYFRLQFALEQCERNTTLVETLIAAGDRLNRKGNIEGAMALKKQEKEFFLLLKSDLETILTNLVKIELNINRDILHKLDNDFKMSSSAYARELGIQKEATKPEEALN